MPPPEMKGLVRSIRSVPVIIAIGVAVACGGAPAPATTSTNGTPNPASPVGSQPTTSAPARTFSIVLNPENGGTIQATLTLTIETTGYSFHLEGKSLHAGSRYLVNTHAGSCAAEDVFQASQPVGTLVADGAGNGLIDRSYGRPYSGGGIITVHGYDGSGAETTHIACAELPPA